MKRSTLIGLILATVGASVVGYFMLVGPHMIDQEHIRAFQQVMPPTPQGTVPVVNPFPPLPSAEEARTLANPLPATNENIARGKAYYEYYCRFCHGDAGDGHGPVGESYVPVPTNLHAPKIQNYSDGQLLRAMLTGVGHEPVLERVVLPEHRWPLVLYTRHLGAAPPGTPVCVPTPSGGML